MCLTLLEFQQLLWPCGKRSSSCITSPWFDPSLDRIQTSSKCKIKVAWNVSQHHATCRNASSILSSPLREMRGSSESALNVDINVSFKSAVSHHPPGQEWGHHFFTINISVIVPGVGPGMRGDVPSLARGGVGTRPIWMTHNWKAQYFNGSDYWNPNLDLCPSGIWKIGTQWLIYWSLGLSMSEKPNITTGATDLGMNIYKINVPNSPTTPTAAVALW